MFTSDQKMIQQNYLLRLREVELGTPTSFLVQDYAQIAVNPNNINVSEDASVQLL
ncbi:MAG: hypothetical protein CM15mP113_2230 [Pseudomonadota bacterium]|nr:MAG: hypothetical protein CM15mP113_2230 [Pseudomonadota bacterium]